MCNTVAVFRSMNGFSQVRIGGTGARAAAPVSGDALHGRAYGWGSAGQMFAPTFLRHMYEYGTTSEQLAWIKVAASHHAQWNEHAFLRDVVTVEDVVNSRMISDPLHLLDCCVVTDGGGALVDAEGNLLGINTAIYSRSGGSLGIGFAIPVSTARMVLDGIVKDGQVTRGWIGVEPSELSPELAKTFGVKATAGVIITGVLQGGPAALAGIRPGDRRGARAWRPLGERRVPRRPRTAELHRGADYGAGGHHQPRGGD